MSETPNRERVLRVLQLVVGAIACGLLGCAAVSIVLVTQRWIMPRTEIEHALLMALLAVAVAQAAAFGLVGRLIAGSLRRKVEGGAAVDSAAAFSTLTIVRGAAVEAVGLFAVVVFLLTANWTVLVVPVACMLILATLFPTRDRLERFAAHVTGQDLR